MKGKNMNAIITAAVLAYGMRQSTPVFFSGIARKAPRTAPIIIRKKKGVLPKRDETAKPDRDLVGENTVLDKRARDKK